MYLRLFLLANFLVFACTNKDDITGTTVGTGNPQTAFSGTGLVFQKSQIDSNESINFSFYQTNTKPWVDHSPIASAESKTTLIDYDSRHWAIDLSSLNWSKSKDSLSSANLIITTKGKQISIIKNVSLNAQNFIIDSNQVKLEEAHTSLDSSIDWSGTINYNNSVLNPPILGFIGTPFVSQTNYSGEFSFKGIDSQLSDLAGFATEQILSEECPPEISIENCSPPIPSEIKIEIIGEFIPGELGDLEVIIP
jgi:hypothetical protein